MEQELLVVLETEYASDDEELAMLTQSLRQELLRTDVADVRPTVSGEVPEGAKALGTVDWSALLVALGGSGGVLTGLVGTLASWIRRNEGTALKLQTADCEVEIKGADVDLMQVQSLLETCLGKRGAEDTLATETVSVEQSGAQPSASEIDSSIVSETPEMDG